MTYDFDTPIDRSGTYSLKWEEAGDALPMWWRIWISRPRP